MNAWTRVHRPPEKWRGRDDGPGEEHLRWHHAVRPYSQSSPLGTVILGFASDEGVSRNGGRPGQAQGPQAVRAALGNMALPFEMPLFDAGDIQVTGGGLERGQARLGATVRQLLEIGHFPLVLGGGHEVAYGSYLGIADATIRNRAPRLGVFNLDAHFDLRSAERPTSGTSFRQMYEREHGRGGSLRYAALGISQPGNTRALFDTAERYGAWYLLDEECFPPSLAVDGFVDRFLNDVDIVHLTVDLDVLSAAVAPGVSAPASLGVPLDVVQRVCVRIASSGKLVVADIAELNPRLDIDARTARAAARLVHRIVTARAVSGEAEGNPLR